MTELTTKYEDIWTNDTEREIVIHFLAYYGTKKLLMMDASSDTDADDDIKYLCPAANAGAILWLENKGTFKTDGYNEFLKPSPKAVYILQRAPSRCYPSWQKLIALTFAKRICGSTRFARRVQVDNTSTPPIRLFA